MEYFLGIDVGGTNVKFGMVSSEGELLDKRKYATAKLREEGNFVDNFIDIVGEELNAHERVSKVGIGVPGTITKDRLATIEMANLPELNGAELIHRLQQRFSHVHFHLENDANAAALGELYFSKVNVPDTFLFVTLGTGVGSAAVIDRKIFKGGDGNAMELGHAVCGTGNTVEYEIGKPGLVRLAQKLVDDGRDSVLKEKEEINAKRVVKAAQKGDLVAVEVFKRGGYILGEGLVSAIRILDIKTIIVGGGVSKTFELIIDPMKEALDKFLTPYYLKELDIRMATLGNEAGIIGAASLCFINE